MVKDHLDENLIRLRCREMLDEGVAEIKIVKELLGIGCESVERAKEIVIQESGTATSLEEHQEWLADELEDFFDRFPEDED